MSTKALPCPVLAVAQDACYRLRSSVLVRCACCGNRHCLWVMGSR
jgi:hypothetical protein